MFCVFAAAVKVTRLRKTRREMVNENVCKVSSTWQLRGNAPERCYDILVGILHSLEVNTCTNILGISIVSCNRLEKWDYRLLIEVAASGGHLSVYTNKVQPLQ